MKKILKIFTLITLTTIIGLSFAACGEDPAGDGPVTPPAGTPIEDTVIDGLWWSLPLILGGDGQGTSGVWVFHYPDFWRLNNWGYAQKGTFTIDGEASGGISSGAFSAAVSRKKDGSTDYHWTDSPAEEDERTWSLSEDGETLAIGPYGPFEFKKITWDAPENSASYNGPWQGKISDSDLNALIMSLNPNIPEPEDFGWLEDENGVEYFKLPPFIQQPTPLNIYPRPIEYNDVSATRDLLAPFIESSSDPTGFSPAPAYWRRNPEDVDFSEISNYLNIDTSNHSGRNTRLEPRVLRQAQYVVFGLGEEFELTEGKFPAAYRMAVCWSATAAIMPNAYSEWWSHGHSSSLPNDGTGDRRDPWFLINDGVLNEEYGVKYDAANRLLVIELSKALRGYDVFAGNNLGTLKPEDPDYNINSGSLSLRIGSPNSQTNPVPQSAQNGVDWVDVLKIENVYLVNIVE